MTAVGAARWATLVGYFGLLILLVAWNAWLSPPDTMPVALVLLLLVGPLLLPMRGLLHGRRYTHAWTSFLAMFYFILGVGTAWADPAERMLGILEVLFSTLLYLGTILYVRWNSGTRGHADQRVEDADV